MSEKREVRSIEGQLRAVSTEDGKRELTGYAVVWESLSSYTLRGPRGLFRERFARGSFPALDTDDCGCYFDHDTSKILGRTRSKTLTLKSDDTGLYFRCELPDITYANDLIISIDRGDIYGCSIGFCEAVYEWDQDKDGLLIGTVKKASLFDVGPVSQPVYEVTSVALRSAQHYLDDVQATKDFDYLEFAKRRLRYQDQKGKLQA